MRTLPSLWFACSVHQVELCDKGQADINLSSWETKLDLFILSFFPNENNLRVYFDPNPLLTCFEG
jgi:hypothetical protein